MADVDGVSAGVRRRVLARASRAAPSSRARPAPLWLVPEPDPALIPPPVSGIAPGTAGVAGASGPAGGNGTLPGPRAAPPVVAGEEFRPVAAGVMPGTGTGPAAGPPGAAGGWPVAPGPDVDGADGVIHG